MSTNRKIYYRERSVPKRARSKRLREAGMTSASFRRAIKQTDGGLSSLWQQQENTRRTTYELSDKFSGQFNTLYTDLDLTKLQVSGMTYSTMTDAEMHGMFQNLFNT